MKLKKKEVKARILQQVVEKGIGDVYAFEQQIIQKPDEETDHDDVVETVKILIEEGDLELPDPDFPIVKPTKKARRTLEQESSEGGNR